MAKKKNKTATGKKIFLKTKDSATDEWNNQPVSMKEFSRVPMVGELIALETSGLIYRVTLVIHIAFSAKPDYVAEVFAVKDDLTKSLRVAGRVS